MERVVKYKVEKNEKYGDFRVVKTVNGEWANEFDCNWTEAKARRMALFYREQFKNGNEK